MACVVMVSLGGARGRLLLLLLDYLLCFVGGHGHFVLRHLGLSGESRALLVVELLWLHVAGLVEGDLRGHGLMRRCRLSLSLDGERVRRQRDLRELRLSLNRLQNGGLSLLLLLPGLSLQRLHGLLRLTGLLELLEV